MAFNSVKVFLIFQLHICIHCLPGASFCARYTQLSGRVVLSQGRKGVEIHPMVPSLSLEPKRHKYPTQELFFSSLHLSEIGTNGGTKNMVMNMT